LNSIGKTGSKRSKTSLAKVAFALNPRMKKRKTVKEHEAEINEMLE